MNLPAIADKSGQGERHSDLRWTMSAAGLGLGTTPCPHVASIYACGMSSAWALCREARRQANLSQRELAVRAQVSPSTVARIERGRVEPTLHLMLRLVHACGLDLRMRLTAECLSTAPGRGLDFEARLTELRNLSAMVLEARRNATA